MTFFDPYSVLERMWHYIKCRRLWKTRMTLCVEGFITGSLGRGEVIKGLMTQPRFKSADQRGPP